MKKLLVALLYILISVSLSFAATRADCPEKVVGTDTMEGVVLKQETCEDGFCFVEVILANGQESGFAANYAKDKNWEPYSVEPGQRLSVQYQIRQFWNEGVNKCQRSNFLVSSKVLDAAPTQTTQQSSAPAVTPIAQLTLYKEFYFGQTKAEIQRMPGFVFCGTDAIDALCRPRQSFADEQWTQVLVFTDEKLIRVALTGPYSNKRETNALGVIVSNDFIPLFVKTQDGRSYDYYQALKMKKTEVAEKEYQDFVIQAATLGKITVYFLQDNAVQGIQESFNSLIDNAHDHTRSIEVDLNAVATKTEVSIRFLYPVLEKKILKEQISKAHDKISKQKKEKF